MLRLSCRPSSSSSQRVRVFSDYAVLRRRWQYAKAKPHTSKHHSTSRTHFRYPFPTHPNPTPFQILHLPTDASPEAIKARYYELVKIYHPDVVAASLSSPRSVEQGGSSSVVHTQDLTLEIAQARFQAVTKAYHTLRKGKTKGKTHLGANMFADATETKMSARRRRQLRARAELRVGEDEKWRERLIVGAVLALMIAFVYQTFETRREGLATAAAAKSRKRRSFEETFVSHPLPNDPTTTTRSRQTIEDENRLAAQNT